MTASSQSREDLRRTEAQSKYLATMMAVQDWLNYVLDQMTADPKLFSTEFRKMMAHHIRVAANVLIILAE